MKVGTKTRIKDILSKQFEVSKIHPTGHRTCDKGIILLAKESRVKADTSVRRETTQLGPNGKGEKHLLQASLGHL